MIRGKGLGFLSSQCKDSVVLDLNTRLFASDNLSLLLTFTVTVVELSQWTDLCTPYTTIQQDECYDYKPSEEWFKKHTLLKEPPKAGQYIAVKLLRFENYSPEYSSYIQARVVKVQGTKVHLKFVGEAFSFLRWKLLFAHFLVMSYCSMFSLAF